MRNPNPTLRFSAALAATIMLLGGCSKSEVPSPAAEKPTTVSNKPLAEAPEEWPAFIRWADKQLRKTPEPVPLPADPHLAEPKWAILRLDEMLDQAQITCAWQATASETKPLATVGPLRSDRPRRAFRVQRKPDKKLGEGLLLTMGGFRVRRENVGSIAIEIRVPFGNHFDLIWSRGGKIRIPLPDNQQFWPVNMATDGLADWSGPLRRIQILTDGVGDNPVEIRSLRFLPRQDAFPQPVGTHRVRLDREARNAIYAHCPAQVKFANVPLPKRAKFQLGLGNVPAVGKDREEPPEQPRASARAAPRRLKPAALEAEPSVGAIEFEVLVEHAGRQTSVLKRRLEAAEQWVDVSADLSAWAGKTVSLILKTGSESAAAVGLWANPFVYEPVDDPPCVVLYLIDALGAKHMDLYGYERPTTPNISALAAEGVWFANTFCNSPVTVSSVPDTQLSMPTERHGVFASSIAAPLELVSLADALRAAGFATALFSTNANAGPRQRMDQGFDHFIDRVGFGWQGVSDRTVPLEDVKHWVQVHRDRPMFLYIHTAEPHAPYVPPEGFAGRFDPDYQGSVDGGMGPGGFASARSRRDIAHVVALYDEEVLYADHRFGLFRDLLGELGLRERANIFLFADHGEELTEHGHWGHGPSLHTEVLHVPLVVAGPLVSARGRIAASVQLHDIMPTILSMYGLPEPYELAGASLLPFLRDDVAPDPSTFDERIIYHSHHRFAGLGIVQYAVIEAARWKLMYYLEEKSSRPGGGSMRFALYDLEDFFYDKQDVIDAHRDVARRLIGELIAYRHKQRPYDAGLDAGQLNYDPAQIRQLQALGYLRGDDEDEEDKP